ncbi:translation initiation factor IF-2 [Pectinatus haikarae]|uniref:Translation initiation factor IF-2 n=1 Tax=Pectinatus haikarae TaxID=349096 RepID=A0ABT9Y6I6_9FIRM|nr:translation initiation factor IF-2 [Pectinatus haikarae]MDQ0203448.1 translation initiation factor IF-2 [Pectinatus haikarae]
MSKYRIYDLAKEFETDSKTVLNMLKVHNVIVKSHASTVGDDERKIIEKSFLQKKNIIEKKIESVRENISIKDNRQKNIKKIDNDRSDNINNINENPALKKQGYEKKQVYKGNDNIKTTIQKTADSNVYSNESAKVPIERTHKNQQASEHDSQRNLMHASQAAAINSNDHKPVDRGDNRTAAGNRSGQGNGSGMGQNSRPGQSDSAGRNSRPGQNNSTSQNNRPGQNNSVGRSRPAQNNSTSQNRSGQNNSAGRSRPGQNNSTSQNRPGQSNNAGRNSRPGQNNSTSQNSRPGQNNSVGRSRPGQNTTTGQNRPGQNNSAGRNNRPGQNNSTGQNSSTGQNNRPGQNNNAGQNNRYGSSQNIGSNRNSRKNWRNNRNNRNHPIQQKQEIVRPKVIKVGETISVKELASKMTYTVTDVIKKLMMLGIMTTINQEIDFDTAVLVAAEFSINVEELPPEVDLTEIPEVEDAEKDLLPRPPVVTVMGHVDHGKTSLLDVIRKTSVTSSEAGGITQHIGAYQVMCKDKKIVFLDTPGHEAFTAMRARGAQVTDIAILVVAADDGVMPQTLEAINHAKAAKVPIVVAINKIDKPGANPEHVKQQLAEHELVAEDWGGDIIMVPVSAKKKMGINDLLEMILLVAEMQELKANPNREARGIIIEAQLDKGRGPVATVLVQSGTLHVGDSIIAGTAFGKVRAMINDRGEKVKKAGPSVPVEVLGLSDVPAAGDEMAVLEEHMVRTIAEKRIGKQRTELINNKKVSLDDLFQQINEGNIKDLNILLKADVQGSLEALKTSLLGLNKSDEVRVSIIHSGVGAVNESDVMLASAANALILAFNVRPDGNARKLADTESIDIRTYRVIYEAINDIEAAMKGMLAPKYKEIIQGKVEIRQVMKFSKALVAGSYVLEGKIFNTSKIRILRDNVVVHEGQIESLRRFKDDVKEVAAGYECGITIENYRDFREKDIIEAYSMEEIAPQSL